MPDDDPYREEPYHSRIRRLRAERDLSRGQLYKRTKQISIDSLIAYEREPAGANRTRYPGPDSIEDVAQALGVEPEEFPEYRLAKMRELLDERASGLAEALAMLERIDGALGAAVEQRLVDAPAPTAGSRRPHRASGDAAPKRRATDRSGP